MWVRLPTWLPLRPTLQGAIMSTLFYEPSTRTRLSFERRAGRQVMLGSLQGLHWVCAAAALDGQPGAAT